MSLRTTALAHAETLPSSACHRVPRSCNRRHASVFCMSLRTTALATADTPPPSACHCEPPLATADTPPPSACHCEPVHGGPAKGSPLRGEESQGSVALLWPLARAGHGGLWGDEAWQSASPGRNAVHCSRARVRAYLPSLSLRTSAHTGVAIRSPRRER